MEPDRAVGRADQGAGIAGMDEFLAHVIGLAGAQAGAIRALTPDGAHLRLVACVGLPDEFRRQEFLVSVCGICGKAVRDEDVLTCADTRCSDPANAACHAGAFGRVIAVPLEYRNHVVGVFNLFFDRSQYVPSGIEPLLKPIGQLLGLTLENSALERENARAVLVAGRQAMATDIHDSLAQTLAFARMRVPLIEDAACEADAERAVRYCRELDAELGRAHRRLRQLITTFRAGMDAQGLLEGLRDAVTGFRDSTGIELDFDNRIPDLKLGGESEVQVFFIVQEALANIRKHARASRARLAVERTGDGVEIVIEDNGCGLPAARGTAGASCGLQIMDERARRFGGRIQFENRPHGGVRVRLFVPASETIQEAT